LIQGELQAVQHGATEQSEGIPMVTIAIKIHKSLPVPYDQYLSIALHTEAESVIIFDMETEWKG
jgi:hypothetical protein